MATEGSQRPRFVFAGGGTGGHLYPALAIAEEIRRRVDDAEIVFIGTAGKIEARVVPKAGYRFETIWISGFRRTLSWSLFLFPVKVLVSLAQSWLLLHRLRPAVVVGTGGYVCGPPVFMASLRGIPVVVQEQNSYPGVTTRMLAKRAAKVFLSYERSKKYLDPRTKTVVVGNPTRSSVGHVGREEAATFFGIDPSLTTVLIFGGSLGASSINRAVGKRLPGLLEGETQLLWQTGERDVAAAKAAIENLSAEHRKRVKVFAFIDRMDLAYGASDIAVCRSGASTLAELALAGVPAVLVPYPFAAADHQTENAKAVAEQGAAVVCPDKEIDDRITEMLGGLFHDVARRRTMAERMRSLARPEAAATIAETVIGYSRQAHD